MHQSSFFSPSLLSPLAAVGEVLTQTTGVAAAAAVNEDDDVD